MPHMRKENERSSEPERLPITIFLMSLPLALFIVQLFYHLYLAPRP